MRRRKLPQAGILGFMAHMSRSARTQRPVYEFGIILKIGSCLKPFRKGIFGEGKRRRQPILNVLFIDGVQIAVGPRRGDGEFQMSRTFPKRRNGLSDVAGVALNGWRP